MNLKLVIADYAVDEKWRARWLDDKIKVRITVDLISPETGNSDTTFSFRVEAPSEASAARTSIKKSKRRAKSKTEKYLAQEISDRALLQIP